MFQNFRVRRALQAHKKRSLANKQVFNFLSPAQIALILRSIDQKHELHQVRRSVCLSPAAKWEYILKTYHKNKFSWIGLWRLCQWESFLLNLLAYVFPRQIAHQLSEADLLWRAFTHLLLRSSQPQSTEIKPSRENLETRFLGSLLQEYRQARAQFAKTLTQSDQTEEPKP